MLRLGLAGIELVVEPAIHGVQQSRRHQIGLTIESTARYSKRPGAEILNPVVRFWNPQSANTGAQKPVSTAAGRN